MKPPAVAAVRGAAAESGLVLRWRLRNLAACAVLSALCFNCDAGRLAADTKLDLTVNPAGFLARSLHLWNASAYAGELQNQAYGYLFPMGPFFALGHAATLPGWVVQRLWWSALLCIAFLGVSRLAGELRIGSPASRFLAALAFAASPHLLTVLGPVSAEALPMSLAPWVLVPLVGNRGTPRRAATYSALAVLAMGAINAALVVAALVPAALFLLLRLNERRGRILAAWWVGMVALVTAWWVVPLLLLGRYGVDFLDHIESASTTTSITSAVESLRGTSDWVAYIRLAGWRAGGLYLTQGAIVLNTVLVVAVGLAGLAMRDVPHRRWLVLCLLAGVCAVGFGHRGDPSWLGGIDGAQFRHLLDGPLAALRNTHKFDVAIRLPLVLGLAHLVGKARWGGTGQERRASHVIVTLLVAVCVAGTAAPLISLKIAPGQTVAEVPGYWSQAARWLGGHAAGSRALVVPGAHTGLFVWGRTGDEPLQPLADSDWEVRDGVPIVPSGHIRALDAVEELFDAGRPATGLADYLARMGIGYLVVRNDLDYTTLDAPSPALVHSTLTGSPGLSEVTGFGAPYGQPDIGVDAGLQVPYRPIEIWRVAGAGAMVSAVSTAGVPLVSGGPESLLDLDATTGRPALFAGDTTSVAAGAVVLTDGMRRRETNYGQNIDNRSATLTAQDPLRMDAASRDYLPFAGSGHQSVAVLYGASAVTASSSASDPDAAGGSIPAQQPFAAADGATDTGWRSNPGRPADGQWWQLGLTAALLVPRLTLRFPSDTAGIATVRTDAGQSSVRVRPGAEVVVRLPAGRTTSSVRVTFHTGADTRQVGLQEVRIPGVEVSRSLQVAADLPTDRPVDVADFRAADDQRSGCVSVGGATHCAPFLVRPGEDDLGLDRTFSVGPGARYGAAVTVTPRPGAALDATIAAAARPDVMVSASSQSVAAPLAGPQTAVDAAMGTGWVADPADADPTLRLHWATPHRIDSLRVRVSLTLAASAPTAVVLEAGGQQFTEPVGPDGTVDFPAVRTDRLTVHLRHTGPLRTTYLVASEQIVPLGVGVSELTVPGVTATAGSAGDAAATVRFTCADGPAVVLDGVAHRTEGSTTVAQLRSLQPTTLRLCGPALTVSSGPHRILVARTAALTVSSLTLTRVGYTPMNTTVTARIRSWGAARRSIAVGARATATLLVVHENANVGWRATLDGRSLRSVPVDGWQQGYLVPAAAAGTVHLEFAADHAYRSALVGGAVLVLVVCLSIFVPARRRPAPARSGGPGGLVRVGLALPVASVIAGLLLAGWAGAALSLLVGAAALALSRSGRAAKLASAAPVSVAAGGYLVAGGWLALHRAGTASYAGREGVLQLLCVLSLSALGWSAWAVPTRAAASREPPRTGS